MAEIEYAFLADAAQIQPGQKFNVLGGGVSRLTGPGVPFVHPHLALVVGLRLTAAERAREHDLGFVLAGPDGAEVTTANGRVVAHGIVEPGDIILNIAVDLWNLTFRVLGEHALRITVDGTERKRLPLSVGQAPAQAAGPEQRYLA
jgi:hypothetical protein